MDIPKLQEELKTRQEAVIKEMNEIIAQEQQLAARKQALIKEAHELNGEARLLERLSKQEK